MDLIRKLTHLQYSIGELKLRLDGYHGIRPWRNPRNTVAYDLWYKEQPLEVRDAEQQLYVRGYYKYEGETSMFHVKDSAGAVIHVEDIVKTADCPEAVVMSIVSETAVQINPIGPGLPRMVLPEEVTVTYSFIEKIRSLKSEEELLAILRKAEGLAKDIVSVPPEKEKRETKKAEKVVDVDI